MGGFSQAIGQGAEALGWREGRAAAAVTSRPARLLVLD